jgi:hypothetical protein
LRRSSNRNRKPSIKQVNVKINPSLKRKLSV